MPLIETANGELFYADHRKKNFTETPVVLIHGAGGSHLDWPTAIRRLPEAGAIAVDLPGHGKSPGPGRNSIGAYAADIVALLDALELPQAIIAGQSMGGAIAQTLALDYSKRVAALILVGTGAKLSVHPNILDRILVAQEEVASLLSDWYWKEDVSEEQRELTYQQIMETPAEITHGDYTACNNFDVRDRLGEISVPTLVIGGTDDRMTPHRFSVYLQEHIPNAQLITIEGGGHMMALEQPETVAEAIRRWLVKLRGNES